MIRQKLKHFRRRSIQIHKIKEVRGKKKWCKGKRRRDAHFKAQTENVKAP